MQIDSVPDHIDHEKVLEFLTGLGITPADLVADGEPAFAINSSGIRARVYARGDDGARYAHTNGRVAIHTIEIPWSDPQPSWATKFVEGVRQPSDG